MQAYLQRLARIPMFSGCSEHELERLARTLDSVTVPPGKVLCEEGTIGREAFIIESGTVEVSSEGEHLADLGEGDHFGELSVIDAGPRTATVVARSDTSVLVLGRRELDTLLDELPGFARRLLISTVSRLREAEGAQATH